MGLGLFIEETNEKIAMQINDNLSIKSIETVAIFMADHELARKSNVRNIAILTDSKSACMSIRSTYINKLERFYEQKILNMAANNSEINFKIQWIPCRSHG